MAQKKAGEVDAFLSRPDTSFPVVLLYGPDPGLVSERADHVAKLSGVDRSDPFACVVLAADELERNIGRLFDEAATMGLFGGRRLLRIKGAGNGKNLSDALAELGQAPPEGVTILIEAGDLKKSSALRLNVERARAAIALPCYQDEGRALDRMIDEELDLAGLIIERTAREMLKSRLGADRLASRSEVRKLCLYAAGTPGITEMDILAVVGDVSAETIDEAVDAAAGGEVRKLPQLIEKLVTAGAATFQLHQALLRHFQALQTMRQEIEAGATLTAVIDRRRPHFRRRAALETALRSWDAQALPNVLQRIERDILVSRKEAALAVTIMHRTLIEIGVESARRRLSQR